MITIQKFHEMRVMSDCYPDPNAEFESMELENIAWQMQWLLDDLNELDRKIEEMFKQSKLTKENE